MDCPSEILDLWTRHSLFAIARIRRCCRFWKEGLVLPESSVKMIVSWWRFILGWKRVRCLLSTRTCAKRSPWSDQHNPLPIIWKEQNPLRGSEKTTSTERVCLYCWKVHWSREKVILVHLQSARRLSYPIDHSEWNLSMEKTLVVDKSERKHFLMTRVWQ